MQHHNPVEFRPVQIILRELVIFRILARWSRKKLPSKKFRSNFYINKKVEQKKLVKICQRKLPYMGNFKEAKEKKTNFKILGKINLVQLTDECMYLHKFTINLQVYYVRFLYFC